MKRLFLVVLLLFLCTLCFASTLNVCLCPANQEIKSFLENTVKTVPYSEEISILLKQITTEREIIKREETLHQAYVKESSSDIKKAQDSLSSYEYKEDESDFTIKVTSSDSSFSDDPMVLKYLCSLYNCEILVFNEVRDLDSVSLRTITVYNLLYDELTEVSTVISSETDTFTQEELLNLGTYFSYAPVTEEPFTPVEVQSELTITSNSEASVFIDGKEVGNTPYVIDKYTLPLMVSLKAEGYSDFNTSITEETKSITAILKPQWMDDSQLYKKSSDSFYLSFGGVLLSIGLKAALNAVIPSDNLYYETADTLSAGLIVISVGNMIYSLIDYYNSATYNTKR